MIPVANQTEFPILHYVSLTLDTTIVDNSRQFIIPFAVADAKYNILGTPFFVEYIQKIHKVHNTPIKRKAILLVH